MDEEKEVASISISVEKSPFAANENGLIGFEVDDLNDGTKLDDNDSLQTFVANPYGLNDGFFSIDDLNQQSNFLE